MNKAEAKKYVGLTKVSKMPCLTFNLPALTSCPRGKKLAEVKGTPPPQINKAPIWGVGES